MSGTTSAVIVTLPAAAVAGPSTVVDVGSGVISLCSPVDTDPVWLASPEYVASYRTNPQVSTGGSTVHDPVPFTRVALHTM